MQYMLIHVQPEEVGAEQGQSWRHDAPLTAWLEETGPTGVGLQGSRLRPGTDATTVRSRRGELIVTDGPFAETKEQLAGYDLLECADIDEAIGWASKHPTLCNGAIEVRALVGGTQPARLPQQREGTIRYVLLVCLGEDFQMGPRTRPRWGRPQTPG